MKLFLSEKDDTLYPNWLLRFLIAIAFTAVAYALSGKDVWDMPNERKFGSILLTYFLTISIIQEYIFMVFIFLARRYLARGRSTYGLISVFVSCCMVPTAVISVPLVMYLKTLGLKVADIPPFKTEPLFLWQTTVALTCIFACCYFKQKLSKDLNSGSPHKARGTES